MSVGKELTGDSLTLERAETITRRRPRLTWRDAEGERVAAVQARSVIGSASKADIVVADRTVSRLHAEVEPREDGLWVRDLGSRNGCAVGDLRIEGARLPHGAALRLGDVVLTVDYEAVPLQVDLWAGERFGPLLGKSSAMRRLFARLAKIAPTESSVLITGETGTGKELVARALHDASSRRDGPLVVVDCAALPDNLLEAELFGHEKGAFTGATQERVGALEAASGGTVFLDEIGELPLAVQPKLLRALESKQVRRLGANQHRAIDVRFLSATHRNLGRMVNDGTFREDLYFRAAVLAVEIPPLRDRLDDLPLLVEHLIPAESAQLAQDAELLRRLRERSWLGNVRELRNVVERVHALGVVEAFEMTAALATGASRAAGPSLEGTWDAVKGRWLDHAIVSYFGELLERHGRDLDAAAREAGVTKNYIYKLIKEHGL